MVRRHIAGWAAVIASASASGTLHAHHSLAAFDTAAPLWIKGTIVSFERVNPHSLILLEQRLADGQIRRWTVDGPDAGRLVTMGVGPDSLKPGDVIEVCGFGMKQGALSQRAAARENGAEPAGSVPRGQPLTGTLLVLAGGEKRFWSDYGHLRQCIGDEERERLPRQWPSAARP